MLKKMQIILTLGMLIFVWEEMTSLFVLKKKKKEKIKFVICLLPE